MEDPDHGWKPNNRPQSTVARNFMSELDDLFKIDGGLDLLDKNVHQKKQAVSTHAQQLEELEARLRQTEERLKAARSSPPSGKDSQRRAPVEGGLPDDFNAKMGGPESPLAARRKPQAPVRAENRIPERPQTAQSQKSQRSIRG